MAGARVEKVGTIFARMNAMLRKKVLSPDDKPIWFEVYALHPPFNEARYDQEVPAQQSIRQIFYEEDILRAKFHDRVKSYETINLGVNNYETKTKKFIALYNDLKVQGALDEEKIFEVAMEQLNASYKPKAEVLEDEIEEPMNIGLAKSFAKAIEKTKTDNVHSDETSSTPEKPKTKPKDSGSIDVKSLF